MGGSMSRIVSGIYIGGVASAQAKSQLEEYGITHVCSVLHYDFKCPSRKHKLFRADDDAKQDISKFFRDACFFIHEARVSGGTVLVHCACGVSRSVTITIAYLMTITNMPLPKLVKAVIAARPCACPNSGFLEQLRDYGRSGAAAKVRQELFAHFGEWPKEKLDADIAQLTELLLRPERATCIGATGGIVVPDDSFGDAVDTSSSNIKSGNHSPQTYIIRKPESFTIYQDKPLYMQRLLAECDDTASTISTSSSVTDITPQKSGGDNR
uniref:Uncharacterized protein n=1 Tax=Trichobilharzia regenti TaxID=157069 RepID=A0AA85IWQ4_TRIRE|nr:unnamed protein product [Trichobilharzia regenti]